MHLENDRVFRGDEERATVNLVVAEYDAEAGRGTELCPRAAWKPAGTDGRKGGPPGLLPGLRGGSPRLPGKFWSREGRSRLARARGPVDSRTGGGPEPRTRTPNTRPASSANLPPTSFRPRRETPDPQAQIPRGVLSDLPGRSAEDVDLFRAHGDGDDDDNDLVLTVLSFQAPSNLVPFEGFRRLSPVSTATIFSTFLCSSHVGPEHLLTEDDLLIMLEYPQLRFEFRRWGLYLSSLR